MLLVSITLHVGLVIGVVLAHFHWLQAPTSLPSNAKQPALVLVPSQTIPEPQTLAPSKPVASSITTSRPALVSPEPAIVSKTENLIATVPSKPTSVLEPNPNANVPLPKPEAVLSPDPAPPLNSHEGVVFLLDVSGSMYEPFAGSNRLTFARQELAQRVRSLKDGTPFAITVYAQMAHNSGPLVAASEATREAAVRFLMEDFDCGGGTNLPAGLVAAQQLHAGQIVLVSDGDLNINQIDLSKRSRDLLGAPGHCPALNVVAICPRSATDAERLLQGLADQQNGNYSVEQADGTSALYSSNKNQVTMP